MPLGLGRFKRPGRWPGRVEAAGAPAGDWCSDEMGSYERYEPPSESRSGISLLWIAAAIAVIGVAGSVLVSQRAREARAGRGEWGDRVDPASAQSEPGRQPPDRRDGRCGRPRHMLRMRGSPSSRCSSGQGLRVVEDRGPRLNPWRSRVSQLQQDSERYRDGLDQAVAELNQLRAELGRLESSARATPQGPAGPRPAEWRAARGPPYVTIQSNGLRNGDRFRQQSDSLCLARQAAGQSGRFRRGHRDP